MARSNKRNISKKPKLLINKRTFIKFHFIYIQNNNNASGSEHNIHIHIRDKELTSLDRSGEHIERRPAPFTTKGVHRGINQYTYQKTYPAKQIQCSSVWEIKIKESTMY